MSSVASSVKGVQSAQDLAIRMSQQRAEATDAVQRSPSRVDGRGPEQVKQSYIQLGQQSIAYYQSVGAGRPIVLVHGNSSSLKVWKNQLEGPLGARYRLIAFDLPGHGNSRRAPAPESSYSSVDAEIETFVEHLFAPHFSPIPEFFAADFRNTDAAARSHLGESVPKGLYKDEISIVSSELKLPLAIACGAEEQIVDLNYLTRLKAPSLWRHEVQIIGSAGHAAQWEQPQAFDKLIDDFASSI
jgi:pimeloyl-ACP methyl ester carboxylesterase